MIDRISSSIKAIANWKSCLIATVAYFFMGGYVMPEGAKHIQQLSGKEVKILDLQFSYTPEQATAILESYTAEARRFAIQFGLIADTIYPLIYSSLFVLLTAWIYKLPGGNQNFLAHIHLFGISILITDLLENIGLASMHFLYPNLPALLIYIASSLTSLKWILLLTQVFIILWGLISKILPIKTHTH